MVIYDSQQYHWSLLTHCGLVSCLFLYQWPMTFLMMPSDWTMSCHVLITGSGHRWKHHRWTNKFICRMDNFMHLSSQNVFHDSIFKSLPYCPGDDELTRYVYGTPTSEVTRVTIRYIRPPHHGQTGQYRGNEWMTHILFDVNRPSHSWDKPISDFDLEISRVKVMGVVKGTVHTIGPVSY